MWSGPGPDPGGSTGGGPPSSQELNDLKDQFEQQQLLIAQLKEMLRKSEQTTVTQEKVEEYANTLTKMKARAKRSAKKVEGGKESSGKHLETPASEKIHMLRQQLEENRAKLAERGKNQKGIEDMVTQMKAQLDDSQILMSHTPLNLSLTETKQESYSINSSSQELYNILINKEKRMSEMVLRIQKLEANVLDLQENVKEKDSVIDARTKAITLMSENLSKKGKSTLDALDDTKLQMRKMQENFVELEQQMKEENCRLLNEIQRKENDITSLKQQNLYLENVQEQLKVEINVLEGNRDDVDSSAHIEKLQSRVNELEIENSNKPSGEEFEKLKEQLKERNNHYEELKLKLQEKESIITDHLTTIKDLENKSSTQGSDKKLANLDIKLENEEIVKLKKQLDESNKNMIKVKAQHKSKIKELNKKVDSFKKMNDANAEVVKLHDENSKLNQKIAELEEEKGALQLKIMETDSTKDSTIVESVNELEKKLTEQAELLTERDDNINTLTKRLEESSKLIEDLNEKLNLQTVQVKSELTSIHLEEQMDKLESEKQDLIKEKQTIKEQNESLTEKLESLQKDKQEILSKLESYMQENIELVDKLEKLSAEKVSSAESIEIVEGLTQQEKLELEAYQKNSDITSDIKNTSREHLEENPELNESVNQLTEETSELLQKIELFTVERREVMEKMEQLTQENNQLNLKIKEIENNRDVLAETYEQLQNEKENLDNNLDGLKNENITLEETIKQLQNEKETLTKLDENNDANKIKEILLEMEEYKYLIEIQRQEIQELKVQIMGQEFIKTDKLELESKVSSLQLQYQNILAENDSLIDKLREHSEHVCQRDDLEEELSAARKRIEEFEEKIAVNLREIEDYKSILEQNKNELITSTNLINELQNNVAAMKNEVSHYNDEVSHLNSVITDLNAAITHLEQENTEKSGNAKNVDMMTNQLEELKQSLTVNIEQINEYQNELEHNSITINQLQTEIKELNGRILETEHLLETKDDELRAVQKEKDEKDRTIHNLQEELKGKDENFHRIVNDFKEKYLELQKQLEINTGSIDNIRQPLENKIQELEHKNREQLEKMKIIAANLKKKTQALQNLEQKYTEANEKWETEQKEKETLKEIAAKNVTLENEIHILNEKLYSSQNDAANQSIECQKLKEELFDYKQRFNSVENMNTKLSEEISNYIARLEDAQNIIREFEKTIAELSAENNRRDDINEKELIIKDLREELENFKESSKANSDALKMKIQEMEMYIEIQDADLAKQKERVNKLEEGLSFMEERRMSLERTAQRLGAELEEKTSECEEVSQTEDILEKRLSALISHDQVIEKKLEDVTAENEELSNYLKIATAENDDLNRKIKEMKDLINDAQYDKEALATMENEIVTLQKTINTLENGKKNIQSEFEHKITQLKEDNEKMEFELQNQLDSFDEDRRKFAEKSESMTDQIKDFLEQQEILTMEISDYKNKLEEQNKIIQAYNKLEEEFRANFTDLNLLKETNKNNEEIISTLNEEIQRNQINITEKMGIIKKHEDTISNLNEQILSTQNIQTELENELHKKSVDLERKQSNQFDLASSFFLDQDTQHLKQTNENLQKQVDSLLKENENLQRIREEASKSDELKSLKAQYNSLEMNYGKLSDDNIALQNHIAILTEELGKLNREQVEKKPADTFTWPGEEVVEVKFTPQATSKVDNTKEELLDKIRSLEFMLHDSEHQKENALMQCNTLSEELTKILYLQQNQQIDLESQILPAGSSRITSADLSQLHQFEFTPTKDILQQASVPVVEESITPKTAYLCYDPEEGDASKNFNSAFGENDDGWGCGSEEAKLEQEHFEQASALPQTSQFQGQISQLEEKIRVLEQTRERHLEELQNSQLKSSKLIKKLKEFKSKNEELASQLNKKSDGFDDLNDAIQDELKSQIKNLEKRIKEINAELEKEKQEKSNLTKRVETLTVSQERMVENKAKQDIEIISWQQRYRELNTKLEQFEWGDDSPKHSQKIESSEIQPVDSPGGIQELTETIRDLTLDNEELQALLEEQRNLRVAAEKAKLIEPMAENMKTEKEYLSILDQRDALQSDFDLISAQFAEFRENYANLSATNEEIGRKLHLYTLENVELQERIKNPDKSECEALMVDIDRLNMEKGKLIEDQAWNASIIEELKGKLEELRSNEELNNAQINTLTSQIKGIEGDKENLLIELKNKDDKNKESDYKIKSIEEQLIMFQNQVSGIDQIEDLIQTKDAELSSLKENLLKSESDYEFKLAANIQQLNEDWLQRVNQRGFDVAESWKMHVEARENEFIEIERQLKKEIADLEEKHTTLVNENNELRKNVDAEIRNEIDRVAALQQQINERQRYINDLSKIVQDQQIQIENGKIEIEKLNSSLTELKNKINEKDAEIRNFQTTLNNKDEIVKELDEKIILYKTEIDSLNQTLSLKSLEIKDRNDKIEELTKLNQNLAVEINNKTEIIEEASKKLNKSQLQEQIFNDQQNQLTQQISNYQLQIQQQYMQIEVLNQQILDTNSINAEEISGKDNEINKLNNLIQDRNQEHSIILQTRIRENQTIINEQSVEIEQLKQRLANSANQYEEILSTKDIDMQNLQMQLNEEKNKNQAHLTEREDFIQVQTELGVKTGECEELKSKLDEQNLLLAEESKQLSDLREIIQDQVLKIDDLQRELYEKSKLYDTLIAEIDITNKPDTSQNLAKHVQFNEDVEVRNVSSNEYDLSEPVSRAELDLALYMLHQRDVRCEELTVELMQLLEERDTLQLKLSNALREKEVLTSKYESSPEKIPIVENVPSDVIVQQPEGLQDSPRSSRSDPLFSKLSELRTVGYRKDKTIVDEQELRRFQQLSIMQQHRDEASKLPPEAAARLVDASYTLSRDVQSPSKVLLNWLWGRSTPKVNNV